MEENIFNITTEKTNDLVTRFVVSGNILIRNVELYNTYIASSNSNINTLKRNFAVSPPGLAILKSLKNLEKSYFSLYLRLNDVEVLNKMKYIENYISTLRTNRFESSWILEQLPVSAKISEIEKENGHIILLLEEFAESYKATLSFKY